MPPPPPAPSDFPLPAVHAALAPYIHSQTTTLRYRQLLTSHLASLRSSPRITTHSGTTAEFTRFLEFELGTYYPVRARHLTALREHNAAKAEYEAALKDLVLDEEEDDEDDEEAGWREDYMACLKLRRQGERLSVLREYLNSLAEDTGERAEGLTESFSLPQPAVPAELKSVAQTADGSSGAIDLDLVLRLEKAVLQAAAETEERPLSRREGVSRKEALGRVLGVMSSWIEHELEKAGDHGEDLGFGAQEANGKGKTVESVLQGVDAAYEAYLQRRQELLEVLAAVEKPVPIEEKDVDISELLKSRLDVEPPKTPPQVVRVLAGIEQLLPYSILQKSLLGQQNHLVSEVSRRRKLLAETVEALSLDEVVPKTQAVARNTIEVQKVGRERAAGDIERTNEALERARGTVKEIEEMGKVEKGEREIPRPGKKRIERVLEDKGLWGGLDGQIGLIGDGI